MINYIELFSYRDGEIFYKLAPKRKPGLLGLSAVTKRNDGYVIVKINGERFYRHRIIWTMFNGSIPEGKVIDHINGIAGDDRIENLRLADTIINAKNQKKNSKNSSGFNGVNLYRNGKWRVSSGNTHIGYYDSLDEAVKAREEFNMKNGFTWRHGK